MRFIEILIGWPGKAYDARVFCIFGLFFLAETNQLSAEVNDFLILVLFFLFSFAF